MVAILKQVETLSCDSDMLKNVSNNTENQAEGQLFLDKHQQETQWRILLADNGTTSDSVIW